MNAYHASSDPSSAVRKGLLALARRRSVEFQRILSEFAIERLLFRLGFSKYRNRFILKGATLLQFWVGTERRATWDLDLLGIGDNEVGAVVGVLREICAMSDKDGIIFDTDSIRGEEIRHLDVYGGVRVRLQARLGAARIPVQVDIGFGDAVIPAPEVVVFPTLLDQTAPKVLVYPVQAVVAEKLEAMVSLGVTNSRMKDFFDLRTLAESKSFDLKSLVSAVRATFERRGTSLVKADPLVLTTGFLSEPEREVQWRAFLRRSRLNAPLDVAVVTADLRRFVLPILRGAASGSFAKMHWKPGGPWQPLIEVREQ